MWDVIVIGGGAAGMAAAIAAAERGQRVAVLERNGKSLKKLGVTGNGRGNLLNSGEPVYYGNAAFALRVLQHMPYARLAAFWQDLGVPLRQEEEGRVYPAALQASVAADALRLRAGQLPVEIFCHTRVCRLCAQPEGFVLEAVQTLEAQEPVAREYRAQRVIVTVGGAAAPAHGADGTGYGLLTAFGHTLIPPRPALCALLTKKKPLQGLGGQRVRSELALFSKNGVLLHQTQGEALFAEDGVSGIAAMQLARFVETGCRLHMDLRPAVGLRGESPEGIARALVALARKRQELPVHQLCTGMMTPPLARALFKAARIAGLDRPMETLGARDFAALARAVCDFSLEVTGTRGFDSAQVTAGGVRCEEFDPATLESRLQKGLHAAGEVLDVDGDCGGYNLMFALSSGLLAGSAKG